MEESRSSLKRRLASLLLSLAAIAGVIFLVEIYGPRLPGTAGEIYRNNVANDIEASALFYTEIGDLSESYNLETGKYDLAIGWDGKVVGGGP